MKSIYKSLIRNINRICSCFPHSMQSLGLWKDTDRSFVDDSDDTLTLTDSRRPLQAGKKDPPKDLTKWKSTSARPALRGGSISGDMDETFSDDLHPSVEDDCSHDEEQEVEKTVSLIQG